MDYTQLDHYRQMIKTILSEYASLIYSYADIHSEVVCYLWMNVGWDDDRLQHATRSPHSWLSGSC